MTDINAPQAFGRGEGELSVEYDARGCELRRADRDFLPFLTREPRTDLPEMSSYINRTRITEDPRTVYSAALSVVGIASWCRNSPPVSCW